MAAITDEVLECSGERQKVIFEGGWANCERMRKREKFDNVETGNEKVRGRKTYR
jgi:hypothetical protein